jgi:hypothetical protein
VYDGNGDEILTYTAGMGGHEKESKAETQAHGALKVAYYDAFRAARQAAVIFLPIFRDGVGSHRCRHH